MKKVVLHSKTGYDAKHDQLLQDLIDRQITLFCVVGKQCVLWEEVMDELVVGETGEYKWHVTTSSHPNESVEDVLEFARAFNADGKEDIEFIEV